MHINKVSLAILVDGKSLYEDKTKVFIPFGTNYELFVKNDNKFDIYISVTRGSLVEKDSFLVKAKTKRIIKGFSKFNKFYQFRFIESIPEIKNKKITHSVENLFYITISNAEKICNPFLSDRSLFPYDKGCKPQININEKSPFTNTKVKPNPLSSNFSVPKAPSFEQFNTNKGLNQDSLNASTIHLRDKPTGIHTHGKPVEETANDINVFGLETLGLLYFDFIGTDSNGNLLKKPLFAKDHIECLECGKKANLNDTYCSRCGSYIIKTADLIDKDISDSQKKNNTCCNNTFSPDYNYCPFCAKEFH